MAEYSWCWCGPGSKTSRSQLAAKYFILSVSSYLVDIYLDIYLDIYICLICFIVAPVARYYIVSSESFYLLVKYHL